MGYDSSNTRALDELKELERARRAEYDIYWAIW